MSEWFETLTSIETRVWQTLSRGVSDRRTAARHPTLATVEDGQPAARTVVLRAVDQGARTLDVHTDIGSTKIESLRVSPNAAFHIWDDKQKLQIRLRTKVTILTGATVADLWAKVPDPSRQGYGTDPSPGTPIATALEYTKPGNPEAFAVLRCQVVAIDALHLGGSHRRASFTQSRDWQGQWLAP